MFEVDRVYVSDFKLENGVLVASLALCTGDRLVGVASPIVISGAESEIGQLTNKIEEYYLNEIVGVGGDTKKSETPLFGTEEI